MIPYPPKIAGIFMLKTDRPKQVKTDLQRQLVRQLVRQNL
jgi:hypothetical protein